MKNSLLTLLLALILFSCSDFENSNFTESKNNSVNKESDSLIVSLSVGKFLRINNDFFVKFDSVLSDSRCPEDVVCLWEGNAEISLSFLKSNHISNFSLNTFFDPREIYFEDYKITIIDVLPSSLSTRIILTKDYTVKLLFLKNN